MEKIDKVYKTTKLKKKKRERKEKTLIIFVSGISDTNIMP
jgi:hypothetical protein